MFWFRNKTITLERMKRSIVNEVRSGDQEGRCLAQYKREMELLQQEKMSHVEELRQIHADINAVSASFPIVPANQCYKTSHHLLPVIVLIPTPTYLQVCAMICQALLIFLSDGNESQRLVLNTEHLYPV